MHPAAAAAVGGAAASSLRIFVVRHEKRPITDPSFNVSLTDEGLADAAELLLPQLQKVGFTKVYTSPFRRVLQTVQPYLAASGLRAHVDWALYEHPEPNPAPVMAIPESFHAHFAIEHGYSPFLGGEGIEGCNAEMEDVHVRTRGLVARLVEDHGGDGGSGNGNGGGGGHVLLLATHQSVVHSLLHQSSGGAIPMELLNVPMGALVELRWREVINFGTTNM